MNKRIDFSFNGGFPLEQDTLDFMQQSYRSALSAIAKLCGNKTILSGMEVAAGNIADGWISVNDELIPFIGGVAAANIIITESPAVIAASFEDGTTHDVYFSKVATCGALGGFPFTDLVRLKTFAEVSGIISRMKWVDVYGGSVAVGDVSGDKFINVTIPDMGGTNFQVRGGLRGLSVNPDTDNDVSWTWHSPTATSFVLGIKDINAPANVQNLVFDFTICKPV